MITDKMDAVARRCPRLGSAVNFGYCRSCGEESLPCFKVFDCWWEVFDITAFMKDFLSEKDFEKLLESRPQPKTVSLVEMINEAKKRADRA